MSTKGAEEYLRRAAVADREAGRARDLYMLGQWAELAEQWRELARQAIAPVGTPKLRVAAIAALRSGRTAVRDETDDLSSDQAEERRQEHGYEQDKRRPLGGLRR